MMSSNNSQVRRVHIDLARLIDQRKHELEAKGIRTTDTEISRQLANNAVWPDMPAKEGLKRIGKWPVIP